ncbi:MAG: family 43 glycosylhydrolase, partial [Aquabacterium sp.]|nr:family 43 glycosylhydrolase [Ferruginibacter sp.]
MKLKLSGKVFCVVCSFIGFAACNNSATNKVTTADSVTTLKKKQYLSQPLVSHIYTADPSAHVFNGKIYIYPSHDTATGTPENDNGDHFNMMDYHIFSMDSVNGKVTDNGVALHIKSIPWAGRQLWAPDAAFANSMYYLYFPVKDKQDIFRMGVATSAKPEGPFVAEGKPIIGSYSIDPCVFKDDDGTFYMYFGGIWGGQLQRWNGNKYDSAGQLRKPNEQAILPRMAKLNKDMKGFAEPVKEVQIIDKNGKHFTEQDNAKRFFE